MSAQGVMGPLRLNAINMASYIIVCSEVRSTIEGELNINIFFRPFASKNIEKLQTNINGTSYLIINILLIATFLYKNDSIELRYSDYEDSFQFLSHFRRFQA